MRTLRAFQLRTKWDEKVSMTLSRPPWHGFIQSWKLSMASAPAPPPPGTNHIGKPTSSTNQGIKEEMEAVTYRFGANCTGLFLLVVLFAILNTRRRWETEESELTLITSTDVRTIFASYKNPYSILAGYHMNPNHEKIYKVILIISGNRLFVLAMYSRVTIKHQ